ncbi:unnamed protein product [Cylicocyclus nassatus]|uniref:BHLH domain-containing protein n=1 Tax=Cylicocyclus nassatus TaxID=53992 RepID=A0AA36M9R8_CYLNA|nr:unnamed protein product [Cylicocyclus nassatus]
MLKHKNVVILPSNSLDPEPLDLRVPKNERIPEEPMTTVPSQEELGGQLLIKLLQQQILLSMLPQPEVVEEKKKLSCRSKEKKMKQCLEKVDMVVNVRRSEANARERNRVQHLADMFDRLRSVLPIEDDVKISKLATLKIASAYIRYLGCVLDTNDVHRLVECEQILMLSICEAKIFPKKVVTF